MSVEKLDFLKQNPFASTMFLQMKQGVIITDCEGTILTVNPYFTQITGYTCEEVQGRNPRILKSNQHPPFLLPVLVGDATHDGNMEG